MKAFILACSNENKEQDIAIKQIPVLVKALFKDGMFGKTTILTCKPDCLRTMLRSYLECVCGLDKFNVCSAKVFYESDTNVQKDCLTVDCSANFEGLESAVVIYILPFISITCKAHCTCFESNPNENPNNFKYTHESSSPVSQNLIENSEEPFKENEFLNALTRATCRTVIIEINHFKNYFDGTVYRIANEAEYFIPVGLSKPFYLLLDFYKNIEFVLPTENLKSLLPPPSVDTVLAYQSRISATFL